MATKKENKGEIKEETVAFVLKPPADKADKGVLKAPTRKGRRAAPTPCPVKMSLTMGDFVAQNSLGADTNTVMLYAVQFCVLHYRSTGGFPEEIPSFSPDAFKGKLTREEIDWLNEANADRSCWAEFAYDLIACFKVKPLKMQNVISYFAATGSVFRPEQDLIALLAWSAGALPSLDLAGLRMDMASWNPFVEYHTKAFSSASLVLRFAEAFPRVMIEIFPDIDLDEVKEVDNQSWNLAQSYRLPQTLLGVVSIWVSFTGIITGANRWYQGEKARSLLPRKEVTLWERFFAKEERLGIPQFDEEDTAASMVAKIKDAGFGKSGVAVAVDPHADVSAEFD